MAGSVGPYGACLHDGSEYTGKYVENLTIQVIIKNWTKYIGILAFWLAEQVLGYQLIYLLWPNMVNEHLTTKWAESFFPVNNPACKMDEKNHFEANLN